MATLTIRDLDERTKQKLKLRAARHNRSMEEEVRQILRQAISDDTEAPRRIERLINRFAELGGVELTLPAREPVKDSVDFGAWPEPEKTPRKKTAPRAAFRRKR